ncbi:MAG TPA: metallophosphoesterase [Bryobacteraceae bacterium]|jgi:putative phosphoesterase|nr:metallophosphoesterase [Bryobacteraceae bacterium]
MRIAVLADIHGNIRALEAVQADLGRHSPDIVVNLGDHVSGPLQAAATADLLMSEHYVQIRGNHDRQLNDRDPAQMGASDCAAYAQLNSRHLEWLANLPASQIIGDNILLCHGSPRDDLEYLLEEVNGDGVRLSPAASIRSRLGGFEGPLILCGHTHIPRDVILPNGVRLVNPGSVGLQAYDDTVPSLHYIENGSPEARYAIIDWSTKGARVSFVVIPYDWESASKEAAKANRPDWAHALATGYALRPGL